MWASTAGLRSKLSPTAWFAVQIAGGVLVFVAAGWIFGGIAEDVVDRDPITVLDTQLAIWFHLHAISWLTPLMLDISLMHGITGTSVMTILVALWLLWSRERYWLLAFFLAVPGGMLLNMLVKLAFHRSRPSFDDPLVTLLTYSFPSGHTAAATVFYVTLASYLLMRVRAAGIRVAIVMVAVLMIVLVALSRIYLGAHFLSDVLAAAAEGVGWVALCLMATGTLQRRSVARRARMP